MADELNTLVLNLDSGGDVVIRLRPDLAPGHVARIRELVEEGFYDGVVFHRVIHGFMAQGGDPTGTGMGGSDKPDLKAEFSREPHVRGTASMARSNNPEQRQQPVLHLLRRCPLPRRPIHGLGRGDRRHGACRRAAQGRAAARAGQDRQGQPEGVTRARPVTLITGASAGLGAEFARQCRGARRGAGAGRPPPRPDRGAGRASSAASPCRRRRPRRTGRAGAACSPRSRRSASQVDTLINNAGFGLAGTFAGAAARPSARDDRPQRPRADRALPARRSRR